MQDRRTENQAISQNKKLKLSNKAISEETSIDESESTENNEKQSLSVLIRGTTYAVTNTMLKRSPLLAKLFSDQGNKIHTLKIAHPLIKIRNMNVKAVFDILGLQDEALFSTRYEALAVPNSSEKYVFDYLCVSVRNPQKDVKSKPVVRILETPVEVVKILKPFNKPYDEDFLKLTATRDLFPNCTMVQEWNMAGLECIGTPSGGFGSSFRPQSVAKQLFDTLTKQIFDGMIWDNVYVAGGFLSLALVQRQKLSDYEASDVDLFVVGKSQNDILSTMNRVVSHFKSKAGFLAYQAGSVVTIINNTGIGKQCIQIINSGCKTIDNVLRSFDLTCSMVAFDGSKFLATDAYVNTICTGNAMLLANVGCLERILKYVKRGFSVYYDANTRATTRYGDDFTVMNQSSSSKPNRSVVPYTTSPHITFRPNKSVVPYTTSPHITFRPNKSVVPYTSRPYITSRRVNADLQRPYSSRPQTCLLKRSKSLSAMPYNGSIKETNYLLKNLYEAVVVEYESVFDYEPYVVASNKYCHGNNDSVARINFMVKTLFGDCYKPLTGSIDPKEFGFLPSHVSGSISAVDSPLSAPLVTLSHNRVKNTVCSVRDVVYSDTGKKFTIMLENVQLFKKSQYNSYCINISEKDLNILDSIHSQFGGLKNEKYEGNCIWVKAHQRKLSNVSTWVFRSFSDESFEYVLNQAGKENTTCDIIISISSVNIHPSGKEKYNPSYFIEECKFTYLDM